MKTLIVTYNYPKKFLESFQKCFGLWLKEKQIETAIDLPIQVGFIMTVF